MRPLLTTTILCCVAALPLVTESRAATPLSLPYLVQMDCDTVGTRCKWAGVNFSLNTAYSTVCSFDLAPSYPSMVYRYASPPGWRAEYVLSPSPRIHWSLDLAGPPCPMPALTQVDSFYVETGFEIPVCMEPQCGDDCYGSPDEAVFYATYYDGAGNPLNAGHPETIPVMCGVAPVPARVTTWGSLKATYR